MSHAELHDAHKMHGDNLKGVDLSFDPEERLGLTTARAEEIRKSKLPNGLEVGYNELPHVSVSLFYLFISQFMGTMPYMYVYARTHARAQTSLSTHPPFLSSHSTRTNPSSPPSISPSTSPFTLNRLEIAMIIAAGCQDWPDMAIIAAMLIANGCLGFREQLECIHSLVIYHMCIIKLLPPCAKCERLTFSLITPKTTTSLYLLFLLLCRNN